MRRILILGAIMLAGSGQIAPPAGNVSRTYVDTHNTKVLFPLGDASFADQVVSFDPGRPSSGPAFSMPKTSLGPPDWISDDDDRVNGVKYVTLGCGGTMVVRFTDNALIDVPGADLYVFEIGQAVEPTRVAISIDGTSWAEIGAVAGGTAEVDIAKIARPGERYRYVRLTDLKSGCSGDWPGADIDAVGAIGAALAINFDTSVLFDFDTSNLKPAAKQAITAAATRLARYPRSTITVEGHTDNVGTPDYNLKLSQARAEAVRVVLRSSAELAGRPVSATGYGAGRPIASNGNAEGRQANRRVEIVVAPLQP